MTAIILPIAEVKSDLSYAMLQALETELNAVLE